MVHNVQSLYLFVVVIIIVHSPCSHAPLRRPREGFTVVPPPNAVRTCPEWLYYEGLTDNIMHGRSSNMMRAMGRDKTGDLDKHVWAACYAYFISSFSTTIPQIWSLYNYCQKVSPDNAITPHLPLKFSRMTCAGWLNAYGFFLGKINNAENAQMAITRVTPNDNDPHVLVPMYSRYIEHRLEELTGTNPPHLGFTIDYTNDFLAIEEFCMYYENFVYLEGHERFHLIEIPFATLDTTMYCHEWIVRSGYSASNGYHNALMALQQNDEILGYHSLWTRRYINYLRELTSILESSIAFTYPIKQALAEAVIYSPEQFCFTYSYVYPVSYEFDAIVN